MARSVHSCPVVLSTAIGDLSRLGLGPALAGRCAGFCCCPASNFIAVCNAQLVSDE
jgi:hypothetical protein